MGNSIVGTETQAGFIFANPNTSMSPSVLISSPTMLKLESSYGWDWGLFCLSFSLWAILLTMSAHAGPMLMTVGPWKPVSLHMYDTKITNVDVRSNVSERLDVNISVDFSLSVQRPGLASVILKDPSGVQIAEESKIRVNLDHPRAEFGFPAGSLELWYPVGYGKQPIYTVEVTFVDEVR